MTAGGRRWSAQLQICDKIGTHTKGTETSVKFQDGSRFLQSRIDGSC